MNAIVDTTQGIFLGPGGSRRQRGEIERRQEGERASKGEKESSPGDHGWFYTAGAIGGRGRRKSEEGREAGGRRR